jgi:hypothetical protein
VMTRQPLTQMFHPEDGLVGPGTEVGVVQR